MNIIIDGYNLLKQLLKSEIIDQKERSWFLNLADKYAHRKRHSLFIVYDGGPYERPTSEKRGVVTVIYSGRKNSADEVIQSIVEEGVLKNLLLVSTDRQLNRHAARFDVPSIDALDFYEFMRESKPVVTQIKKETGLKKMHEGGQLSELDLLMAEASSMPVYKKEEDQKEEVSKKRSKKEKRDEALVKKL